MIEAGKTLAAHFEQVNLTKKESNRFWSKVDKDGPVMRSELGKCWEWTAAIWARGYGAFTFRGGQIKSHRLIYLMSASIPKETPFVLHRCDNRKCCNPEHLFLGTYATNASDCTAKGRHVAVSGDKHYSKDYPEKVAREWQLPQTKLSDDMVRAIRIRASLGEKQCDIALRYGVSRANICLIVSRKSRAHVLDE